MLANDFVVVVSRVELNFLQEILNIKIENKSPNKAIFILYFFDDSHISLKNSQRTQNESIPKGVLFDHLDSGN